jgi:uncharacterized protein
MAQDLNNAELDELDDLLAQTPQPLEALDLVMLDGYLAGVLVQPRLIAADEWLPPVFDLEGRPLPADVDPQWRERVTALVERRHAALTRALAEDGWFDPVLHEEPVAEPPSDAEATATEVWAALSPISRQLFSWVAGFQYATTTFPELVEEADDEVALTLDRVFRHLPPDSDEERELLKAIDAEHPVSDLDDAVEDLVAAVSELWELTSDARYRVEPVRREAPKVGRNDPCPCGSGKKFKQCHGK